jgi:hypothetical protein
VIDQKTSDSTPITLSGGRDAVVTGEDSFKAYNGLVPMSP